MKSSNKGKDFCVFALPGLFCFLAVVMVPFIYGIYLTLTDWNGVSSVKNFVGLSNFAAVMRDAQFWKSLLLTFKYVIAVVVLVNVIAFLLAYILTRGIKGQNFFRAGFFTPNLIGGIVLGYIWQFVFSRVFVSIGETTGWSLFEISWLSTPNKAFAALVLVSVWQLAGYMILIRRRLYGTFRGRARGGKHRRCIRLGKNEKHYPSADDVLRYYLPLPDPVPCVHGIRCQPVLNRRCSVRNHRDGSHARI